MLDLCIFQASQTSYISYFSYNLKLEYDSKLLLLQSLCFE